MSEKEENIHKIAQSLKNRPIISISFLQKIFQGLSKKQILTIFFSFAQIHPQKTLFSFQLKTKHENHPQDFEEDANQSLDKITVGYADYNELIQLKRQTKGNQSRGQLQKIIPQAIFDPQLQRIDVIKTIRKPRPERNFKLTPKQYISIVRQDAKKYDEQQSKREKMPKNLRVEEKREETETKNKEHVKKKTLKLVEDLPRLNSKEGEKVKSTPLSKKMQINSESEEEQNKQMHKTSEKPEAAETERTNKMQIEEEEDDEQAQFIKFMNNKEKPENISTNLPNKSANNTGDNKKKVQMKEEPKKVTQKNKSVVVGNNQKTLFAFMGKK